MKSKKRTHYTEINLMSNDFCVLCPNQVRTVLEEHSFKTVLLKCEEHLILARTEDLSRIKNLLADEYHLLDGDFTQLDDLDIQQKIDQFQKTDNCEQLLNPKWQIYICIQRLGFLFDFNLKQAYNSGKRNKDICIFNFLCTLKTKRKE